MRVPIAKLMGVILAVSLGLATLRSFGRDAHRPEVAVVGLLGLLAGAAALLRGRPRITLAACAGGGCLYLMLAFGPGLDPSQAHYLPGTAALNALYPRLGLEARARAEARQKEKCTCRECVAPYLRRARSAYYRRGQIASALVAALVSGLVGWGVSWWFVGVGGGSPNPRDAAALGPPRLRDP